LDICNKYILKYIYIKKWENDLKMLGSLIQNNRGGTMDYYVGNNSTGIHDKYKYQLDIESFPTPFPCMHIILL
jgi:hypothetical protein